MTRLKAANLSSVSTGVTATVTAGATTITWSADPKLPTVAAPDILPIVLAPNTATAEVVYVTAHTAGATSSTVIRLAEALQFGATTAAAFAAGTAWSHTATIPDLTANFGGGSLLGQTVYNPTTQANTSAPASLTAVDSANLAVTFITPPSGKVIVRLNAGATVFTTAGTTLAWGIMEGAATVAGPYTALYSASTSQILERVSAEFTVTGLVPGSQHTYLFAHASVGSTNAQTSYGGTAIGASGPASISVLDASAGGQGVGAASGVLRGDAGWTPFVYQNSWVDYGAPYDPGGYRKDASGRVFLRGLIKSGTVATVIATLPIGYRPDTNFIGIAWNAANAARINVGADGTIVIDNTIGSPSGTYQSLDGITFLAAGETGQLHDGGGTGGVVTPLLGLTSYTPVTDSNGSILNAGASTTIADIDATNLGVTFTAPASGRVTVTLEMPWLSLGASVNASLGLREGTTILAQQQISNDGTFYRNARASFVITGLTPGSQHTYKAAYAVASSAMYIGGGATRGAAVIKVEDAGIGTAGTNLASPVNLLGITSYQPGTLATYSTASATLVDVDATNAIVTFTAPQSGRVLIHASAFTGIATGGSLALGLREGTAIVAGPVVVQDTVAYDVMATADFLVTGLTPGSVHTYKLAFGIAAGGTAYIHAGGSGLAANNGALTLIVTDATVGLGGSGALVNSNKLATPVTYAAGADAATYTVAVGTVLADVDATNLAVTITAPPSGKIVVRTAAVVAAGASGVVFFGLREATTVVAGPSLATNSTAQVGVAKTFTISGLTPGSVHTYKLAAYATTAAGAIYTGPTNGQVVLEVEDAQIAANGIQGNSYPSTTTAPAAGGAGALPATPLGYITVNINGVNRQMAYY